MRKLWLLLAVPLLMGGDPASPGDTVILKVKENKLRDAPRFLAAVTATVKLGDRLEVLEVKDLWYRAKNETNQVGWLHDSSVSPRKAKLSTAEVEQSPDLDEHEAYLATKGFNERVEADHRREAGQRVDYDAVNRLDGFRASEWDLQGFIRAGGLEGAQ